MVMSLNIKDQRAHRLAKQLARLTGESMTQAVKIALEERLGREKAKRGKVGMAERLMEIGRQCAALPVRDDRSPDEILGYDEHGLPT
jgi:antitoxin VapB